MNAAWRRQINFLGAGWIPGTSGITAGNVMGGFCDTFRFPVQLSYFYNYHNSSSTALLFIMWIFPLVGYLGVIVGFAFLTLAIGKSSIP